MRLSCKAGFLPMGQALFLREETLQGRQPARGFLILQGLPAGECGIRSVFIPFRRSLGINTCLDRGHLDLKGIQRLD